MPNGHAQQAHLDALAQQQGFKNYAQWAAWNRNTRQVVLQGGAGGAAPTQPPQNWLQHLLSSIPGHPAQLLGYVDNKMGQALGSK